MNLAAGTDNPEYFSVEQKLIGYMENFRKDGVITLDVIQATKLFPTKTCSSPEGKAGVLHPHASFFGLAIVVISEILQHDSSILRKIKTS